MSEVRIESVRNLLYETMQKLADKENPMDIGQAKTIANVARVLVESAKVEVSYMKLRGQAGTISAFLSDETKQIGASQEVASSVGA